ncbi:MAG TPA: hypothetical protein VFG38_13705 [Pseudomonadales bacterium]|nr:hypothetical protein [Pseudomonadales bacterium]
MPIRMIIDKTTSLIRTTASGRVTGDDLVAYYHRLRSHPDFRSDLSEIFDLTDVTEADVGADDVRRLSSVTEEFTRRGVTVKVAIVAPRDLEFGLSRMYEMLQSQSKNDVRVFRDRAEAEAWIFAPREP